MHACMHMLYEVKKDTAVTWIMREGVISYFTLPNLCMHVIWRPLSWAGRGGGVFVEFGRMAYFVIMIIAGMRAKEVK